MDSGPFGKGSLLHSAGPDGALHVPGHQDDPDDGNRSAAAGHDEVHAHRDVGNVRGYPLPERAGRVYSYQRTGRHSAAVVAESHASAARARKRGARQKRQEQETISRTTDPRSLVLFKVPWLKN